MAEVQMKLQVRRFTRIAFHRPGVMHLQGRRASFEVLDISLRGALVEVGPAHGLEVGATCALLIRLDAGDATIRMDGEVAHVNGQRVGVKVDELDLESMEHLRRLLELNLEDDAVVQRELAALVSERDW